MFCGHWKLSNTSTECFFINYWYTNFTRFHPMMPGCLVFSLDSVISFGLSTTRNTTFGTLSPRNVISISKYLVMGILPPFTALRWNKLCKVASSSLADPSFGLVFLSNYFCWTRPDILIGSRSDAIFFPIHSKLTFGLAASAIFTKLNFACNTPADIFSPKSKSDVEPLVSASPIGLSFNGASHLMTVPH